MSTTRRGFLACASATFGGLTLLTAQRGVQAANDCAHTNRLMPRQLGRTGVFIPALSLDTSWAGLSPRVSVTELASLTRASMEHGATSIDTARRYGKAEEAVGAGVAGRRHQAFLITKVFADSAVDAEQSLGESLRALQTDYVDLLCFHNLGRGDVHGSRSPEGVFSWLLRQREIGRTRFVGLSLDNLSERAVPLLSTGEVDAVLMVLNPVDRYRYAFESRILPLANALGAGVIATRVFGGSPSNARAAAFATAPGRLAAADRSLAAHYALDLPGVASVSLPATDLAALRENVCAVASHQPLTARERLAAAQLGRSLVHRWPSHFGPAVPSALPLA